MALFRASYSLLKSQGEARSAIDAGNVPVRLLIGLAVEHWRLNGRIAKLRQANPQPDLRALEHSAGRFGALLQMNETEWHDHTGEVFSDGMLDVKVIHFDTVPSLSAGERRIIEVIEPRVMIRGKPCAAAQVIVGLGTPPEEKTKDA